MKLLTHGCACKTGCTGRCGCHKAGTKCGPGCRCINCTNRTIVTCTLREEQTCELVAREQCTGKSDSDSDDDGGDEYIDEDEYMYNAGDIDTYDEIARYYECLEEIDEMMHDIFGDD